MTIFASGLKKHLYFSKETEWGTLPPNDNTAIEKIRVQSTMSLQKSSFNSQQIRPSAQLQFTAQGVRSAAGAVAGEIAPQDWADVIASALRGALTVGISKTNTDFGGTLAATAASSKFTVSAGDWVTAGFRVGDVFTVTGTAGNTGQNFRILSFASTNKDAIVDPAPVDMTAQAAFTVAVVGKKVVTGTAPTLDESYTIEHWHEDISQSERFSGNKINGLSVSVPSQGYNSISVQFTGKDRTTDVTQYFSAASPHVDLGLCSALHTKVSVNGSNLLTITGLQFSLQPAMQPTAAIGSPNLAAIVPGMMTVSGSFTAYFTDEIIDNYFDTETEVPIGIFMPVSDAAGAKFVSWHMPTCKIMSANTNDTAQSLIKSYNFTARLDTLNTVSDMATLIFQDSDAA